MNLARSAFLLLAFLGVAFESNPAGAELHIGVLSALLPDLLCYGSHIFVAEVIDGRAYDCRFQTSEAKECSPRNLAFLTLRVKSVIARSTKVPDPALKTLDARPDTILDVELEVENDPPNPKYSWPPREGTIRMKPPTGEPLTDRQVREKIVGKQFIVSSAVWFVGTHPPRPYGAFFWPMEKMDWVRGILAEGGGFRRACRDFELR